MKNTLKGMRNECRYCEYYLPCTNSTKGYCTFFIKNKVIVPHWVMTKICPIIDSNNTNCVAFILDRRLGKLNEKQTS